VKKESSSVVVLCNNADLTSDLEQTNTKKELKLEYRSNCPNDQNIKISLPDFVQDVFHLPDRVLDLLEIASYIFSADRSISRGNKNAIDFIGWARPFHFVIKVRDIDFWNKLEVKDKLTKVLNYMTGDEYYKFSFQPGHSTPPTSLFDVEKFELNSNPNTSIILFSGGLDSLTGIIDRLENSDDRLCLISHRSGQPGTARTQDKLYEALKNLYPNRIQHYKFYCSLKGYRAVEETQRTRSFLYSSIAYSLSSALSQKKFFVYENGITSINFPKRQDLINSRASRTTHPKTIVLLEKFFSELEGTQIKIETPFFWKTKSDLFKMLKDFGRKDLITSSVSCSRTFQNLELATHCGVCSQCIDRRFASYSSESEDIDNSGIYALEFINNPINNDEVKTTLIDYIRQARDFATWNTDHFYSEFLSELVDIIDYVSGDEEDGVMRIYNLCNKHGKQVLRGIKKIRDIHENLFTDIPDNSLLKLISDREYLKEPIQRLVSTICNRLSSSIPLAFQTNPPRNENDFNDKVSAILNSEKDKIEREHPSISFALAKSMPDHNYTDYNLFIESKYLRGSTTPSKASEGIAADITKYPEENHILFVVYDPERSIINDENFKKDFELKRSCTIFIVR